MVQQLAAKKGYRHKGQSRPRVHLLFVKSQGCEPGEAKPPILTALLSGYLIIHFLHLFVLLSCVFDCMILNS